MRPNQRLAILIFLIVVGIITGFSTLGYLLWRTSDLANQNQANVDRLTHDEAVLCPAPTPSPGRRVHVQATPSPPGCVKEIAKSIGLLGSQLDKLQAQLRTIEGGPAADPAAIAAIQTQIAIIQAEIASARGGTVVTPPDFDPPDNDVDVDPVPPDDDSRFCTSIRTCPLR